MRDLDLTTLRLFVAVCEAVLGPDYKIVEVGFDIPFPGAQDLWRAFRRAFWALMRKYDIDAAPYRSESPPKPFADG